ncbi:MAG: tetratricopeptide repeat protein, partial [Planctomycetes bacterium]|nr:tetratricopeptide repeat protein [Planctomycetota bacterium]
SFKSDPIFDGLRSDPRFDDLLRRIGFEPDPKPQRTAKPPPAQSPNGKIMLAVLPFEDMSPEPQEWFSDGMTEEMIAQLGRLHPKKLGVIARTSAMRFKNTDKGIDQIGRELGVDYILEGSVRRAGERVRITAQLVQVSDQTHLWAQSYNRHVADVFAIQIDVAEQIARALALELLPGEQAALAQALTPSPAAHEAYLRGRYYWNKRTPEGLKKGLEHFQRAVEQDPGYALAYAGVADSYAVMASWNLLPPDEGYPKAKAAATKALEIDDTLAEAHALLAVVAKEYDWDFSRAERGFRKALQLNPGYATAHQWYAEYLAAMGRHEEAIAEIERAEELDPLSLIINAIAGYVCYFASEYDQAIDHCQKALELDPNFATAHYFIGWVYERKGMYGEAIAELQKARTLSGNIDFLAVLAHAYAVSGRTKQARKMLDEVKAFSERAYVSPYVLALIYMGLGEKDQAFAWLETAYAERAINLVVLKVDPRYDELRGDPRFDDLLRRIGLLPTRAAGFSPGN